MAAWSWYGPGLVLGPSIVEDLLGLLDGGLVPLGPVLGVQGDEVALLVNARRLAGTVEHHERQEPFHFGLFWHELGQHPGQHHGVVAQAFAHQLGSCAGGVTLVEEQVEHGQDARGALGQGAGRRHAVWDARMGDLLLGPYEALGHGGFRDEESASDLGCRQPGEGTQGESNTSFHGHSRVAAGEYEAEPLVGHAAVFAGGNLVGHARLLVGAGGAGGRQRRNLPELGGMDVAAAEPVDGPVASDRHQPGARPGGTPSLGQRASAWAKASWAHSSARSQSPVRWMRAATIRPHSSRKTVATT